MCARISGTIDRSLSQAQQFFERCFLEITLDTTPICAFPEMEGKQRVTEWGATSSGLAALHILGISSQEVQEKFNRAKAWLLDKQCEGKWEASGFCSAEPTAGVMLDLVSMGALPDDQRAAGVGFLKQCFKHGYYASLPDHVGKPRLFTTYIVAKCLNTLGEFDAQSAVQHWLLTVQTTSGRWGMVPNSTEDSPLHTAFAIELLSFCGVSWDELRRDYRKQIAWIFANMNMPSYVFEEIEMAKPGSDLDGQNYHRIRMRHCVLPVIGNLAMELSKQDKATQVVRRILSEQCSGGWGPTKDELAIWATQQACCFLASFKRRVLPSMTALKHVWYRVTSAPYWIVKLALTALALIVCVSFVLSKDYRPGFLVALVVAFLPWLFRRD